MRARLVEAGLSETIAVNGSRYTTDVLFTEQEIQNRVGEMGGELAGRFAERGGVHVLTVLSGAFHFASDLRRAMGGTDPTLLITSDQVQISSYGGDTKSSGIVRFQSPPSSSVEGKHVLVAEDIIDTGRTMRWLIPYLEAQDPASIEIAVALQRNNPDRRTDFLGGTVIHAAFELDADSFVVGYGLDLGGQYRDMPEMRTLTERLADL